MYTETKFCHIWISSKFPPPFALIWSLYISTMTYAVIQKIKIFFKKTNPVFNFWYNEIVRREMKNALLKERTKKCIPSLDKSPVATQSLPVRYEKKRKHLLPRYCSPTSVHIWLCCYYIIRLLWNFVNRIRSIIKCLSNLLNNIFWKLLINLYWINL